MEDPRERIAVIFIKTAEHLPEPKKEALLKQARKVYSGRRTVEAVIAASTIENSGGGFYRHETAFWRGLMYGTFSEASRLGIEVPKHAREIAKSIELGDNYDILRLGAETAMHIFRDLSV